MTTTAPVAPAAVTRLSIRCGSLSTSPMMTFTASRLAVLARSS
jgi:hypothetical protein